MKISMIVAMSSNRVIGINNKLPWKLSADMAWFKKQTINKVILLGRKTWESLPIRPLPGRKHIIISRNKNYQPLSVLGEVVNDIAIAGSIEEAISIAKELTEEFQQQQNNNTQQQAELMIIGGASIYQLALPYCQRLYQTIVEHDVQGDAWFPELNPDDWQQVYSQSNRSDAKNQFNYTFKIKDIVN